MTNHAKKVIKNGICSKRKWTFILFRLLTKLVFVVILFFPLTLTFGQKNADYFSGTVIDSKTLLPVPFATVYVNGTTIGCISNEKGEFILNGITFPCQIIATQVSYERTAIDIKNKTDHLKISLNQKVIALNEVIVGSKKTNIRKTYLQKFKTWFLGNDSWGRQAKLLNDSVLVFSKDTQGFYARTSAPLEIELPRLGYKLQVDLVNFQIYYNEKYGGEQCFSTAFYYFIPINPDSKKEMENITRNRLRAYYGSELHFCRSLYIDSLGINGYKIFNEQKPKNGDSIESVNTNNVYVIINKEYIKNEDNQPYLRLTGLKDSCITIHYYYKNGLPVNVKNDKLNNYSVSRLFLTKDTCIIRANGTIPDNSIMFDGAIGKRGVGSMLPEDYYPELLTRDLNDPPSFDGIKIGMSIK